ncbi:MAG: hypothetical protein KF764_14055 [Labilithrix sp.]|nr:hypothetical protein [Labilithrix sp.]
MKKIAQVTPLMVLALAGGALIAACEDSSSSVESFDASTDAQFTLDAPTTPVEDAQPPKDVAAPDVADAAVVSADLALDFSSTANPNGAWTFGYTMSSPAGDASALIPFTTPTAPATDIDLWFDPTHVNLDAPSAFHNRSNSTVNGVAPGEAGLHPGSVQEYAVARWTAPVAGKYAVKVQFKEGDQGDTNGLLLHNGVVLVNEESTSTNAVHELNVTLAAGDTLDVAVGNKGDFIYDSTPVIFSIRTAP